MRKGLTVTVDAWGNVIVAGPVDDDRGHDTFVTKLDREGNVIWQRFLNTGYAGTSSMPPPPIDGSYAAADPRDSFEPMLMAEADRYQRLLARRERAKNAGLVVAAMALVACASTGAFMIAEASASTGPAPLDMAFLQRMPMQAERITAEMAWLPPALGMGTTQVTTSHELRDETVALLSAGLPAKALPHAQAYVTAAPEDAHSYLCLGAALQDMGRPHEAQSVYSECVTYAKRGNVAECYALGGSMLDGP